MTPLVRLDPSPNVFPFGRQEITAVNAVSLDIHEGEILCMVGESGCGKTTTGKMISRPDSVHLGRDRLQGTGHLADGPGGLCTVRKDVQVIHQDPYASLNPVRTVYKTLSAPAVSPWPGQKPQRSRPAHH